MKKTYRDLLNQLQQLNDNQLDQPMVCESGEFSQVFFPDKDDEIIDIGVYNTEIYSRDYISLNTDRTEFLERIKTEEVVILTVY